MVFLRFFAIVFVIVGISIPPKAAAQIYADVTVNGNVSGTFTISLQYQKAPATVANFIGLATGKKGWIDVNNGSIHFAPFYNGVTFHRVIAGFMSQTGSRLGDGTDGPGYSFRNEIDPTLTFATPYTVAMANSGKNTNGSQWFVTSGTGNNTGLNGGYTIFGVVTSGTAVCDALNNVPTTGSSGSPADRPLSPETITSIIIYGPSYASFNLTPDALPKVFSAQPVMKVVGTSYSLGYDHSAYSTYIGYHSPDLKNWASFANVYFHSNAPVGDADVTRVSTGSKHFYRLARVDYSKARISPDTLAGKTLQFSNPIPGTLVVNSAGTTGTWAFNGGAANPLTSFAYSSTGLYTSNLLIYVSNGFQFAVDSLEYSSPTSGTYTGRTNLIGYANVSGTFTSSP